MKKTFLKPEMDIINIEEAEVLTESCGMADWAGQENMDYPG